MWTGGLAAWAWAYLPYRVPRSDGKFLEVKAANLIWQVHPDRPELLTEILDWYDDVAGDVDRLLTVQAADGKARASVAAHGYAFDAETGSDNGFWVQFNVRELADVPDPVPPKGFRFLAAEDVSAADAVKAHRDAWYPSSFTEAEFERVRRTWPYRADLHVLIEAPDGTLAATAIVWLDDSTPKPLNSSPSARTGTSGDGGWAPRCSCTVCIWPGAARREPHAGRLSWHRRRIRPRGTCITASTFTSPAGTCRRSRSRDNARTGHSGRTPRGAGS